MKAFFTDLLAKIKSDVVNAVALVSTALGTFMTHIDDVASQLGDPGLTQQIKTTIITDAKWFGHWMTFVGLVAIVARFKKLVQSPPKS